jgi:Tol biopolymer transport system component
VRRKTREALAWGLAGVLGVATLGLAWGYLMRPAQPAKQAFRATLMPPPGNAIIPFDQLGLSLSPDGKTLAFVAAAADGRKQIWLRNLTEMQARPLAETGGASYPFWSPDGGSLGFFADGKLKTIDLRGGSPRVVSEAPSGRGGTWGREGIILFAPNITSSILRVPATGGKVEEVTKYDPKTESTQRWPVFLPDGRHFLYLSRARVEGREEQGRLMLASLDDPKASVLIGDSSNAQYVEPGYLIYGRSANLYAWRFDAKALRLEGDAAPIVPDKLSYWEAKNFVPFAAAGDGTIVFLPESRRSSVLRWYDRLGRPGGSLGPPGYYLTPKISPDGRKVAYMQAEGDGSLSNIWVRELDSSRAVRLTPQAAGYVSPAWSPDGSRIVFQCQPKGVGDLCITPAGGGGELQVLYESNTWKTLGSWMPDGKRLLFANQDPKTEEDIVMMPAGGGEPRVILRTPFQEQRPIASPDGTCFVFVSNVSGRFEVYVRNLGGGEEQWQISTDGGGNPKWRADGKELFYEAADGYLMAVPWHGTPGTPVRLFQFTERSEPGFLEVFGDVTPDGQRLLLNVPTTSLTSVGFYAITNWPSLANTSVNLR